MKPSVCSRMDVNYSMVHPDSGWLPRDDLLTRLAADGYDVSNYQLLRWVDVGLLPPPRRVGLGRGRGTVSYYPPLVFPQAATLHLLLRERRSLDQAGWYLWVFGYPVAEFAHDLLLEAVDDELDTWEAIADDEELRDALAASTQELVKTLGRGIPPDVLSKALRDLSGLQLGTLADDPPSSDDWLHLQDAVIQSFPPEVRDADDLPDPLAMAHTAKQQAHRSLYATRQMLETCSAIELCVARDVAQTLYAWLVQKTGGPPDALIPPEDFIRFVRFSWLNESDRSGTRQMLTIFGLRAISPLARQLKALGFTPRQRKAS